MSKKIIPIISHMEIPITLLLLRFSIKREARKSVKPPIHKRTIIMIQSFNLFTPSYSKVIDEGG